MSYMKLIKLLYLADREHIRETGHSITKDTYFLMKNGPVLSNVLDLINCGSEPDRLSYWDSIISNPTPDREVVLQDEPTFNHLSETACRIADRIFDEYGSLSRWRVRDLSHAVPEYQPIEQGRVKLRFRDIATAVGFSAGEIKDLEEESQANSFVHEVLGVRG